MAATLNQLTKHRSAGHLLALLAGALFPLGFSPFDFWPVLLLATGVGFYLSRTLPVKSATFRGFLFGLGIFGSGTSWVYVSIHQFGSAPIPLAASLTALFVACLALLLIAPLFFLYAKLRDRFEVQSAFQQALLFSGLWVLFEWSRSWLLTGFPWLLQGYSLIDSPFQSWAPVVGVYGLSLLLVLTASLTVAAIISDKRSRIASIAGLVSVSLIALAAIPLDNINWTSPVKDISFSAVQGDIPQAQKWEPGYVQTTVDKYYQLSETEWQQDLIIWPENALPVFQSRASSVLSHLDQQAKNSNTALILGLPIDDYSSEIPRYYNGIVALGKGDGQYYKQKLVPFGEYVPLESALRGLISFFDLPMSSFSQGDSTQTLLQVGDTRITTYICYEVVYPDFAAYLAKDSGLLITVSNDTWFGQSIGPQQHFQMARMRSLETGRYMIRATNDGITALINDKGEELDRIERFQPGVLRGSAVVMSGETPFMHYGSWPVLLLSLFLLIIGSFRRNR